MSKQYENNNDGVLFPNDKKTGPNSPSSKGHAHITCPHCGEKTKFWISAWTKMGRNARKFLTMAFSDAGAEQSKKDDMPF